MPVPTLPPVQLFPNSRRFAVEHPGGTAYVYLRPGEGLGIEEAARIAADWTEIRLADDRDVGRVVADFNPGGGK